jgi:hypothetical protein
VAALLVALAVLAALAAEAAWLAGRALDADRFAEATGDALRSPEGRAAVADRIQAVVRAQAGEELPRDRLDAVLREAAGDPRLDPVLAAVAAGGRDELLADGADDATLDLAPLRPAVAEAAERLDPELAARLPPAEELGAIELPDLGAAPPRASVVDELPRAGTLAGLGAAALVTLALMVSPRRAGTARAAGIGLLVAAALPPLARFLGPEAAEGAAEGGALGPFAERLTAELLADWWIPCAVCAGAGLALLLGAALSPARGRGRPSRPRAGRRPGSAHPSPR